MHVNDLRLKLNESTESTVLFAKDAETMDTELFEHEFIPYPGLERSWQKTGVGCVDALASISSQLSRSW